MELINYGIPLDGGIDMNGSDVTDHPESSPIFNAIKNGRLDCIQLLVEHKASLTIKMRTWGKDEYPPIIAILEDKKEIIEYIIGILGRAQALHQLNEELLLRAGPDLTKERPMISIVYDNLLKQAGPSQVITFFSSSAGSSHQSTSAHENDRAINLTP